MIFLIIILLALAVEAVTEILTSSELTEPFRLVWKRYTYPDGQPSTGFGQYVKVWLDKLITCGYCTSVWVAAFFAVLVPMLFESAFVNWLCFVFVLHRLANWIHIIFELIKKGRIKTYDLVLLIKQEEDLENENGSFGESSTEGPTEIKSGNTETGNSPYSE